MKIAEINLFSVYDRMENEEVSTYKNVKRKEAQKKYREKEKNKNKNKEKCKKYYGQNQERYRLKSRLKYYQKRENIILKQLREFDEYCENLSKHKVE